MNITEIVDSLYSDIDLQEFVADGVASIPSTNGFGAFFFPELVSVDEKDVKLKELQKGKQKSNNRDVVLEHVLPNGEKVVVSDDGLVVVFSENKQKALSFLNTIFATALTLGVQGEFLRDKDVCDVQYYGQSKYLWINSYKIPSERMTFCLLRDNPESAQYEDWRHYPRRLLKPDECKKILDRSYEYTTKPELHEDLLLAFEGYTLLIRDSFKGAFLYGWMIIEVFLAQLWEEYVDSQKRTGDDKKALKDFRSWTGYHHIEIFATIGKISPTVRNLFNRLRKKRNDIVHRKDTAHNGESVTKDEAAGCLHVAVVILLNRLKNPDTPFLDLEKTPLVELWKCQNDADGRKID